MAKEALRRRGPKPDPDRGTPSGYRVNDRTRFELQMAGPFLGTTSLQDTIAVAVEELLERMRSVDGYQDALRAAEKNQRNRAGVRSVTTATPDQAIPVEESRPWFPGTDNEDQPDDPLPT